MHTKGNGHIELVRVGTVLYNRAVVNGIVTVESIGRAQERFGHKPLTGEQVRWGIENLAFDVKKIDGLGAHGLMAPFKISCADHEEAGAVRFLQWTGEKWVNASNWINTDQSLVRPMLDRKSVADTHRT